MSSAVGNYVISYDTGNKPFKHDVTRGKWSSQWDFSLACITHAFGLVNFSFLPVYIMMHGGALFVIPYILCTILFVLPIFFIQTFLGQFSSTGFISVFRISPLFKGIAYVIVALNIIAACINAVGASFFLVYFFASFTPNLPWMTCNHSWNDPNCMTVFTNITNDGDLYRMSWSTVEYFRTGVVNFSEGDLNTLRMAWPVFGLSIVTWLVVGVVLYKGIESVTHFLRYSAIIIVPILLLIFLRVACLPDSINGLQKFLFKGFKARNLLGTWVGSPLIAVSHFGTGWGIVLTMASHNNFKANVYKNALVVTLTLICLGTISGLTVVLTHEYLKEHLHFHAIYREASVFNSLFLGFPHLFGNIEASNMWSLLFFLMLALCELNAVVIILFSTMTSLFDEYEYLRIYKKQISVILPAALFVLCIAFTTNFGYELFSITMRFCGASQMGICFLELMIAVWIYGRQRFQRDVQFMLGHTVATWQFYLVRFVTPLFILFLLFIYIMWSAMERYHTYFSATIVIATLKFFPWIFIPAYVVIKLVRNSGKITARFKRCVRPNDWYPADAADRQRYEETLGNADISHQLVQSNFNEED